MNRCLWCEGEVETSVTFSQIFYEKPLHTHLCSGCRQLLKPVADSEHKCISCCKLSEKEECLDCVRWKKMYPDYPFKHESLFYYNSFAKEYMEKYKIMGDCELSLLFAGELKTYFKPKLKRSVIVPIPSSEKSRTARGFNQVELLLESAGLPYLKALDHIGKGEKQARKNRGERMEMTQPFSLNSKVTALLEGNSVILVDDLYTTGRTVFHAADALRSCSPGSIQTFSLFR